MSISCDAETFRGACGCFKGRKGAELQLQPLIISEEKENTPVGKNRNQLFIIIDKVELILLLYTLT